MRRIVATLCVGILGLASGAVSAVTLLDDTRILFDRGSLGSREIYVTNIDGTNETNLTNNAVDDFSPSWSPDGSQIVFFSNRDGGDDLFIMDADGLNPINVTGPVTVAADADPSWSPDGTRIAFVAAFDVWVINVDGTGLVNLTTLTDNGAGDGLGTNSAWSPDSARIVFGSQRDGDWEIYTMNADGSDVVQLTDNDVDDFMPAWSPDGLRIVWSSVAGTATELWVMDVNDPDGLTQRTTTGKGNYAPDWSPDGTRICVSSNRDGDWDIFTMNADGTAPQNIASAAGNDSGPAWSPFLVPMVTVTAPIAGQEFPPGTTAADLTTAALRHAAPGHWHWQLDAPFPDSGAAGGNHVDSGVLTDTITGLGRV